jgi:exopolysaccharide biosynthesis polyprenyl glycosylphosphotransferase
MMRPFEVQQAALTDEVIDLAAVEAEPAFGSPSGVLRFLLIGLDLAALTGGWAYAVAARPPVPAALALAALVFVGVVTGLAFLVHQRLYLARVCALKAAETLQLARAAGVSALAVALAGVAGVEVSLALAVRGAAAAFVLLLVGRTMYRWWLELARREGHFLRHVVLVGGNEEALSLSALLREHPELGLRVTGVVTPREETLSVIDAPWVGTTDDCVQAVRAAGANGVVIAVSALSPDDLNRVVRDLLAAGIHVHLSTGLRGIATGRVRPHPLAYEPLFYVEPAVLRRWQTATKRALDLVLGALLLLAATPLLALAALAVRLGDGGSVLFRQERVGRDGRLFTLYKLRTMVPDAEERLAEVLAANQRNGPLFKLDRDPRVTRVGRFLRATSIDELPQLLNVLRGEMSLVGPRPALLREVEQFDSELQSRSTVLPGITGLWQVEARDLPSFAAYRRLDGYYVENWSIGLDFAILLATIRVVLLGAVQYLRSSPEELWVAPQPYALDEGAGNA